MIGQLVLTAGGRGRAAPDSLYGLPVLRAEVALEGFWGERRLRRACRALCRGRARRALVLREDGLWSRLEELGLRPVDPVPFLRAQAVPLALADLARQGLAPDRAVVALRGTRAGRDMVRTAQALCPLVRALIVDAPWGGAELAAWLREEFGIPILPGGEQGQTALRFQEGCPRPEAGPLRAPAGAGRPVSHRPGAGGGGSSPAAPAGRPLGGGQAGSGGHKNHLTDGPGTHIMSQNAGSYPRDRTGPRGQRPLWSSVGAGPLAGPLSYVLEGGSEWRRNIS